MGPREGEQAESGGNAAGGCEAGIEGEYEEGAAAKCGDRDNNERFVKILYPRFYYCLFITLQPGRRRALLKSRRTPSS